MVGVTPTQVSRLRLAAETEIQRTQPATTAPAVTTEPSQQDQLNLSAQARGLPEAMVKGPPVDRSLVDRLGAAIADGRYPIDPAGVADAMLRDYFDISN
jgi:flagellar biosynthesis anti-sigma factor FlgM